MKSFSFPLTLEHEIQSSPFENIRKNLCIDYNKNFMKLFQFEREKNKRIDLLFNVM